MKMGVFIRIVALFICLLSVATYMTSCDNPNEAYYDNRIIADNNNLGANSTLFCDFAPNQYDAHGTKYSGVKLVRKMLITGNDVFDIDLNIKSGKFKIVMVSNIDNKVYTICDEDTTSNEYTVDIPIGFYLCKYVGYEADFTLKFSLANID